MQGQKALEFHKKRFNLCSEDDLRSYRFGMTWGWVINDRIFISLNAHRQKSIEFSISCISVISHNVEIIIGLTVSVSVNPQNMKFQT